MLRAYPQDHPMSQHICNSRVSRPPYMATRQPGITPKYGHFSYILGLNKPVFVSTAQSTVCDTLSERGLRGMDNKGGGVCATQSRFSPMPHRHE